MGRKSMSPGGRLARAARSVNGVDICGLVDACASGCDEMEALCATFVAGDEHGPFGILGIACEGFAPGQGDLGGQLGCARRWGEAPDEQAHDDDHTADQRNGQRCHQPPQRADAGWFGRVEHCIWIGHG